MADVHLNSFSCEIDWSKCLVCQTVTKENIQFPWKTKRDSDVGAGYHSMADNLHGFAE